MNERWARTWFALTAAVGISALVTEFVMSASHPLPHFATPVARVTNELFYFTILSNLLVAGVMLLLAVRLDRPALPFRVFRLSALTGIVITAVVYHLILASQPHLGGVWLVTNHAMHTVVPIMAIGGWLVFGPRGLAGWRAALLSLLFPGLYLVVTLVRGPVIDWYPYFFLDVRHIGYARMGLNALAVALFYLGVAALIGGTDKALLRRREAAGAPPAGEPERTPDTAAVVPADGPSPVTPG